MNKKQVRHHLSYFLFLDSGRLKRGRIQLQVPPLSPLASRGPAVTPALAPVRNRQQSYPAHVSCPLNSITLLDHAPVFDLPSYHFSLVFYNSSSLNVINLYSIFVFILISAADGEVWEERWAPPHPEGLNDP